MRKFLILLFCLSICTAFFALGTQVKASVPIQEFLWEQEFEATNWIFFMTPTVPLEQLSAPFTDFSNVSEERLQIRTGLYHNTTPPESIYYLDISANKSSVFFCSCGIYIVTMQNTLENYDGESLGGGLINFFEKGVLISSFDDIDLLRNADELEATSAGTFWRDDGSRVFDRQTYFDAEEKLLTVRTAEGNVFVFNVVTGNMITQMNFATTMVLVLVGVFLLSFLFILSIQRKKAGELLKDLK